jgi:hypothetical protein
MPVVLFQEGFHFMIYYNDHPPPHTHVFKAGTEVVINLGDADNSPTMRDNKGMSRQNIKRALEIADENQSYLLERWHDING